MSPQAIQLNQTRENREWKNFNEIIFIWVHVNVYAVCGCVVRELRTGNEISFALQFSEWFFWFLVEKVEYFHLTALEHMNHCVPHLLKVFSCLVADSIDRKTLFHDAIKNNNLYRWGKRTKSKYWIRLQQNFENKKSIFWFSIVRSHHFVYTWKTNL